MGEHSELRLQLHDAAAMVPDGHHEEVVVPIRKAMAALERLDAARDKADAILGMFGTFEDPDKERELSQGEMSLFVAGAKHACRVILAESSPA